MTAVICPETILLRRSQSAATGLWERFQFMNELRAVLLAAFCSLAGAVTAQDTNSLKTDLGIFEARTGVVIVKGFGQIGSITAGTAEISVRCKETADLSVGRKAYGLAIEINGNSFPRERILVDDDEIDALLSGINYLIKINYDVTTLPAFEASYTTKAGLRVTASSVRRDGGIQFSVQSSNTPRISLSSVQMTQLYGLIGQARKNLDDLKAAR